jgi:hypothetical protein
MKYQRNESNNFYPMGRRDQLGAIGSVAGGLFGSLLGGGDAGAPAQAAMNQINPFLNELQSYRQSLMPYQQNYENELQGLVSQPNQMVDQIMQSYHQSPYAQNAIREGTEAARIEAANRGDLGTPQEQERVGQRVSNIVDQDELNYLRNILSTYGMGLSGLRGLSDQMPSLYNAEGQTYGTLASLQGSKKAQQENQGGEFLGGLMSLLPLLVTAL